MTAEPIYIDDPHEANWISDLQRAKGKVSEPAPPSQPVARIGGVVEMAYSPGQKRDNVGRFGSGGGKSAPASGGASGAGVAGETDEGASNNFRLQGAKDAAIAADRAAYDAAGHKNVFTGKSTWVATDADQRIASSLKDQAMRTMGADLDAAFPEERLLAEAQALNNGIRVLPGDYGHGETAGDMVAQSMLDNWQGAAYDPTYHPPTAIQRAVSEEFATGLGTTMSKDMSAAGHTVAKFTEGHDMEVLRAGVRSMHTATQKRLDEMGVGDTVTVYRGVGRETHGTVDVDSNPASSWSFDRKVAAAFAQKEGTKHEYLATNGKYSDGTVYTMTVPRKRILAMPGSGVGCFEEAEVVLTRGTGDRALGEPGPGPVV